MVLSFGRFVQQLQRLITDKVGAIHYERVLLGLAFSSFIGFFIAGVSLCIGCFIFLAFIGLNLCAESALMSGVSVIVTDGVVPGQSPIRRLCAPGVQLKTMR